MRCCLALTLVEREAVIAEVRELVAEYGITVDQIYGRKRAARGTKQAAMIEAKYQNPKTSKTWSGRGRAPGWIRDAKNRDRFLIAQ